MFDDFADDDDLYEEEGEDYASAPAGTLLPPRENPELFGHEHIEQTLISLYSKGTLPHALIFAGPMGVGKTTMAFRFARFLLSQKGDADQDSLFGDAPAAPTNMNVASDDPIFRKVASGGHPDLRTIERPIDEKKGVRKGIVDVESVRTIAPFLRMSASEGGWRIVIVDEADLMNRQSQNAILKILEEPPPQSLLILVCNRLGAMIPTIRSRCRVLHFAPLDNTTLATLLKRAMPQATSGDIALLSLLSDGSMGRAVHLQEEGGVNMLHSILDFLTGWPKWDWAKIHPWADNLSRAGDEKSYLAFTSLMEWVTASILRAKAAPERGLPEILNTQGVNTLQNHYSLEQMIDICEKLKAHFISIENSNLDKRQGVIGAFAILGGQTP
ncbi:MAG TPA: DNA polymerase III subunit delta' [Micavibrio sp.]|nr:DNA polymerase III subunit delta' [Micavibrio sp.]